MASKLDLLAPKPVPYCCIIVLVRQRVIVLLEEEQPPPYLLLVLLIQIPALAGVLAGCYVSGFEPVRALVSLLCKFQNVAPATWTVEAQQGGCWV